MARGWAFVFTNLQPHVAMKFQSHRIRPAPSLKIIQELISRFDLVENTIEPMKYNDQHPRYEQILRR